MRMADWVLAYQVPYAVALREIEARKLCSLLGTLRMQQLDQRDTSAVSVCAALCPDLFLLVHERKQPEWPYCCDSKLKSVARPHVDSATCLRPSQSCMTIRHMRQAHDSKMLTCAFMVRWSDCSSVCTSASDCAWDPCLLKDAARISRWRTCTWQWPTLCVDKAPGHPWHCA
jgi:hypothetical protein